MREVNERIWPSKVWVCGLLFCLALSIGLKLSGWKSGYGQTVDSAPFLIGVFSLLIFLEVKVIDITDNQVVVRSCLGFKRKISLNRVRAIQLIKQQDVYYLLIVLDSHETFGGYNEYVLPFAYFSPIKVIHLIIPA